MIEDMLNEKQVQEICDDITEVFKHQGCSYQNGIQVIMTMLMRLIIYASEDPKYILKQVAEAFNNMSEEV